MAIFSGIAAAFGAISTFIGGLGALGSFLLQSAVGIGLNLLAASLAGKEKEPSFSINGDLRGGGDLARSFIIGKYMTAGSLVWANTWGSEGDTPNAWLTQVILLSDLPSKGLAALLVDGKPVTYGQGALTAMGYAIPEFDSNGPNLYVKFYDGTQVIADPFLVSTASTAERPYAANRVGHGLTYVVIHARSTRNMFSGFPALQFVVDGTRLYDISKDSTKGGSGSHRWADKSTWGGDGDENPIVQAYNLFRGVDFEGRWLYGLQQLPESRLPAANWIAGINKARIAIPSAAGTEQTYRSSGEVDVSIPVITAIETILTTCQGRVAEIGGTYRIFLGAPDASTVTISDGDILSTEGQTFTPFQGIADSINGVSATYPSIKDNWNMQTAPPLLRPDLEARDGNRRLLASIELSFVPYDEQVQRLMKSALEEAMRFRRHTISLPPWFWPYAVPGEIIEWNSIRNGYVNKLFRIDGATDGANLDVLIDITEVDPADYDWNSDEEFQPITEGSLGVIRPPAQTIFGWNVAPATVRGNGGEARRPGILISWANTPGVLLDVTGIRFEIRNKTTQVVEFRGYTNQPEAGSTLYSQGLLPNTDYEVRGRYETSGERELSDSGWLEVRTPDVLLGGNDIYLPGVVEDLEDFINDATLWIRDGVRQTILESQRLARIDLDQMFLALTDRQTIRQELTSTSGDNRAYALDQIEAATGPNSAIARRISTVEAQMPAIAANAAATTALTARVSNIEGVQGAQASSILDLQAQINGKASATAVSTLDARVVVVEGKATANAEAITAISAGQASGNTATANFRMSVQAGPSGYASRIAMEARTGGAGAWRAAGLYLDVPASSGSPTRISLQADQISFTDGSNIAAPFIFEGGVLYLNQAKIKQAQIDNLLVGTSNIVPGAVTTFAAGAVGTGAMDGTKFVDIVMAHPDPTTTAGVILRVDGYVSITNIIGTGGNSPWAMQLFRQDSGANLATVQQLVPTGGNGSLSAFSWFAPAAGTTSTTVRMLVTLRGTVASNSLFGTVFKR